MKVKIHNNAIKNLERLNPKTKTTVQLKIKELLNCYNTTGIIPYNILQIKKLKGSWKDFFSMRVGKIRIIYKIDNELLEIQIFEIDKRGDVYK
ncbi:MAG: type II toxin-antitoxin system RelE/ParE family toxin [Bacteroidetes bacterium]|nr:type II toxin-antitoxin system RelE/ParE family toxin [Bacteroidota bacterium]